MADLHYFRIRSPTMARVGLLFVQLIALAVGAPATPASAAAQAECPALIVGTDELDDILGQTLGSLRDLADQRSVSIDPSSNACYVRINLSTSALSQFGAACNLEGCSSVLHRRKSIALREFDVAGCEPLFNVVGLSRHVPSTYVDASARIRQQCGSDDFDIASVTVVQVDGEPKLRFDFRSAAARR